MKLTAAAIIDAQQWNDQNRVNVQEFLPPAAVENLEEVVESGTTHTLTPVTGWGQATHVLQVDDYDMGGTWLVGVRV